MNNLMKDVYGLHMQESLLNLKKDKIQPGKMMAWRSLEAQC